VGSALAELGVKAKSGKLKAKNHTLKLKTYLPYSFDLI